LGKSERTVFVKVGGETRKRRRVFKEAQGEGGMTIKKKVRGEKIEGKKQERKTTRVGKDKGGPNPKGT